MDYKGQQSLFNVALKVRLNCLECRMSHFGTKLPNVSLSQGWQMWTAVMLWPHFILRGYEQVQIDKWGPIGLSKSSKNPLSLPSLRPTSWKLMSGCSLSWQLRRLVTWFLNPLTNVKNWFSKCYLMMWCWWNKKVVSQLGEQCSTIFILPTDSSSKRVFFLLNT